MDAILLNEYLSNNINELTKLLTAIGCHHIEYNEHKHEIRCARPQGNNPTSIWLDTKTLYLICFSTGDRCGLINYIMLQLHMQFYDTLIWVQQTLDLNPKEFISTKKRKLPFGGWYRKYSKTSAIEVEEMTVYPDSILDEYMPATNKMFFDDGISFLTQEKYGVRYDPYTDRVLIPQRNVYGQLVGIQGRMNQKDCDSQYRWLPIIPYKNSQVIFGYSMNYSEIAKKKKVILTESAKGVMQLSSMGIDYGLAFNGCNISDYQAAYIKMLPVDEIILAFDQGLSLEKLKREANKLKPSSPFFERKVGHIADSDQIVLQDKEAPTDKGAAALIELLNNYVHWL